MIGRKGNEVGRGNIGRLQLVSDVAEPVISIQRLIRFVERSWIQAQEIPETNSMRMVLILVLELS